ncbi:MAG: HlyC/CorC family transporter [Simkaniaceae bacterium]|nr:HlyC/CorC family transporter [Simkaniaceae bacterium]
MILTACLILLVLCSALFSASETSLFSLSAPQLKHYSESGDPRLQKISLLLKDPQKLLVTILMMNVFVNLAIQNTVSSIFGTYSGWLVTVIFPLALVLVFGEVIPKSMALLKNQSIAVKVTPFIDRVQRILRPLRDIIVGITRPISRYLFFFLHAEKAISVDALKHSLRTSKDYGILTDDEAHLVRGYLNLQDMTAKEIMTPRQDILYFDIRAPLSKLVSLFIEKECSRVPVCDGELENVLGIISAQEFFLSRDKIHTSEALKKHLVKAEFLPETMEGKTLLQSLYHRGIEMILVVDEYGSITGLVTLEDVVEVAFGQIADKRDEKSLYTISGENVIICSGKLELKEFEEIFDIHLESENNMATVGGYLMEQMGDIPKSGDKFYDDHFLFHVLAADVNRVRRVYVRKLG